MSKVRSPPFPKFNIVEFKNLTEVFRFTPSDDREDGGASGGFIEYDEAQKCATFLGYISAEYYSKLKKGSFVSWSKVFWLAPKARINGFRILIRRIRAPGETQDQLNQMLPIQIRLGLTGPDSSQLLYFVGLFVESRELLCQALNGKNMNFRLDSWELMSWTTNL